MATAARLASRVLPSRVLPSRPTRSRRSRLAARAASSSPDDDPSPPRPAYDRAVHAIVVGGSSGMGKAAALECVKRGGSVLIASRSRAKLERARAELASTLGLDPDEAAARVALDVVDASDEASVEAFFSRVAPGEYNALIVSAADRFYAGLSGRHQLIVKLISPLHSFSIHMITNMLAEHVKMGGAELSVRP